MPKETFFQKYSRSINLNPIPELIDPFKITKDQYYFCANREMAMTIQSDTQDLSDSEKEIKEVLSIIDSAYGYWIKNGASNHHWHNTTQKAINKLLEKGFSNNDDIEVFLISLGKPTKI